MDGRFGTGLAVGGAAALLARDLDLPTLVSFWGSRSPLVPALALLLALVWMTRLRRLVAGAALLLALAWLLVVFTPLTTWMAQGLPRRDVPRPADAVFVLASRTQDDGEPTCTAQSRLLHGLELLGEGRAPRLVVSELPPPYAAYAPLARSQMARLGVQGEVLAVGPVRSTREEALLVARLFKERGWKSVLLVSSPTHTRRAAATFAREGLDVVSSPALETQFDLERLDRPDDRLFAFSSLLHERAGLAFYRWRGWMD